MRWIVSLAILSGVFAGSIHTTSSWATEKSAQAYSNSQIAQTTVENHQKFRSLNEVQAILRKLEPGTVAFYPMILNDRIDLVLISANAAPIHRSVPINQADLNRAIVDFRSAISSPDTDAKAPAKALYDLLIKPIEPNLKQVKTLLYVPDDRLRSVPLAALYDGQQWLTERFGVNTISSIGQTNFDRPKKRSVLAAATSGTIDHSPLPFQQKEVEAIKALIPDTKLLLNQKFTREALLKGIQNHTIVHLATEVVFTPEKPEASYILLGDGNQLSLNEVKDWNFSNVDLLVLSSCETALSGRTSNGTNTPGFANLLHRAGAKSVLASLWEVYDEPTQVLMDQFYQHWVKGGTKTEALRQAQLDLIRTTAPDRQKAGMTRKSSEPQKGLSHPFYWAGFVLIGNGL